jgi:sugar phosphate isomerase/epimerase
MKLALCNEMFEGWRLADVFAVAAELGFDAVEIAPYTVAESAYDITPAQRNAIRRDAERAGVEIAGLHWLFVSPKGLSLNGPDAALRATTRDYLMELVRFCSDVGGRIMVLGSPQQRNVVEGVTRDEAFAYARDTFRACAELAGELDVLLCMEPLTTKSTNFITTPTEALSLIEAVNHPNFQMILDVYSSSAENLDIPFEIRRFAPWIRHVHANDDNGYLPGSGGADYDGIVAALREVAYAGYLSVEVFDFKPDPRVIASRTIEFLRKHVPVST